MDHPGRSARDPDRKWTCRTSPAGRGRCCPKPAAEGWRPGPHPGWAAGPAARPPERRRRRASLGGPPCKRAFAPHGLVCERSPGPPLRSQEICRVNTGQHKGKCDSAPPQSIPHYGGFCRAPLPISSQSDDRVWISPSEAICWSVAVVSGQEVAVWGSGHERMPGAQRGMFDECGVCRQLRHAKWGSPDSEVPIDAADDEPRRCRLAPARAGRGSAPPMSRTAAPLRHPRSPRTRRRSPRAGRRWRG